MYQSLGSEKIMAEADIMYRKYISEIEGQKNKFDMFKTVDKIGLVNTDDDDGGLNPAALRRQSTRGGPNTNTTRSMQYLQVEATST
jgi:hypothetical protein